jgi:hypothetical protein
MIQKRNVEACEHAFEYWKQNATHTEANRATCLALATQMMTLIKAKAPAADFQALEEQCEAAGIDAMGHGGYGLHSAIIAVLSDLGAS